MQLFCVVAVLAVAMAAVTAQDGDRPCFCVHYTLCNQTTKTIIDDGSELLGSRVDANQRCDCPGPNNEFGGICAADRHMCCHLPEDEEVEPEVEESWDDCGKKGFVFGTETASRVIAGADKGVTSPSEFPWMALLVNKTDNSMVCGGSILHHHVIMTAAHCVHKFQANELLVRASVWNKDDLTGTQSSGVQKIIKHGQFGPTNYRNDLALLVLKKQLVLSDTLAPICQPPPMSNYDGMECIATGWGTSQFGTRQYSSVLKKVTLHIVPHDECQTQLRATRLGPWFKLHNSFVCAKGEAGTDTCTGDGGGPLICSPPGSEKYIQVGITAAGLECGNDIPALYTNIPRLQSWIEKQFITEDLKNLK